MPPKAKAKAKARTKPAAKAKAVDRYAYLPTDLQRAAMHMDLADSLRKLPKSRHDREYRHARVPPGSPAPSRPGCKDRNH